MNILQAISLDLNTYLSTSFSITPATSSAFTLNVDPSRQTFGDLTTNSAMVLAKELKQNPRAIAEQIITQFKHPYIERMEIAGPGFINAWLSPAAYALIVREMREDKDTYFKSAEHPQTYNIEFISANPTGPLHLGHGRGGIIGDVLANVLSFIGHHVTKEFYINDAGNQIAKLGNSLKIRCQQVAGMEVALPEDGYQGAYLKVLAQECMEQHGSAILNEPAIFFADYAKNHLLQQQKDTLQAYGITFNVWFSEKKLHLDGSIERALERVATRDYLYEQDGALWFKSTAFGDDKDRVVRKADGQLTYVAADIAYLINKIERGFDHLIMVLGHDHHSYMIRLHAVLQSLGVTNPDLQVILYQLVTMKISGALVQMSKRAGTMVTLQEVIDEVGTDVARFFYLNRKADAQLEFDLDLALKKTDENPVYYIQYAYVRTGSILERAAHQSGLTDIADADAIALTEAEHLLIKKIASLKSVLTTIATSGQTHHLSYYTIELADLFHSYYAANRVIVPDNLPVSRARLLLVMQVRETFALLLTLLGLSKPDKM